MNTSLLTQTKGSLIPRFMFLVLILKSYPIEDVLFCAHGLRAC
jgi:hypothetical protein